MDSNRAEALRTTTFFLQRETIECNYWGGGKEATTGRLGYWQKVENSEVAGPRSESWAKRRQKGKQDGPTLKVKGHSNAKLE